MPDRINDDALMRELAHLGHVLQRRNRRVENGSRSADFVLAVLATRDEALATGRADRLFTQVELADVVGMRPQTVGAIIGDLEREGLVKRAVHAADRRAHLVELTSEGRVRADGMRDAWRRNAVDALKCLTDEEKDTLAALVIKLNTALE